MHDRSVLARAQLLALSLPTFVFAGYDLTRHSFLAPYLSGELGLTIGVVGWLVTLANFASIPAEVLMGVLCDRGSARIGHRAPWMLGGTVAIVLAAAVLLQATRSTGVGTIALSLTGLVMGWAICNVTHGAWALEVSANAIERARVFGLRTLSGIAGGIGFSLIGVAQTGYLRSPVAAMLVVIIVATPVTHGLLVALVPDRQTKARPWRWRTMIDPLRIPYANAQNRRLAALFALNGAHTAITSTGYLYITGSGLGLRDWGPTGVLAQALCAALGIVAAIRLGRRLSAPVLLRITLWANLLMAAALIALPPHQPVPLMLWSVLFGLFSAIDFMALRVLLGGRLDADRGPDAGDARAAAYYAGFHLPFNLCGALATGVLFLGYKLLGFDPNTARSTEQAFTPVILCPALAEIGLMAVSLGILARFVGSTPFWGRHRRRLRLPH
ncbi:MAG: MFS transporter [Sphingomonas sp.]|uniref:MFS transporter n=2 Tax=Pseudomonadota TaxID=1224 RepID=UPI0030FB680F